MRPALTSQRQGSRLDGESEGPQEKNGTVQLKGVMVNLHCHLDRSDSDSPRSLGQLLGMDVRELQGELTGEQWT